MREFIAGSSSARRSEQKSLPSVTILMETCFFRSVCNNQGEEAALCGCLPPIGTTAVIPAWFAP